MTTAALDLYAEACHAYEFSILAAREAREAARVIYENTCTAAYDANRAEATSRYAARRAKKVVT